MRRAYVPILIFLTSLTALYGCDGGDRLTGPTAEPSAELAPPAEPGAPVYAQSAAVEPSSTVLVLSASVYDPCRDEVVELHGDLRIQLLARAAPGEGFVLHWAVQATDVVGLGSDGGTRYRLVGAPKGSVIVGHDARAVTVADFRAVALGTPGTAVGRASVGPGIGVALEFEATSKDVLPPTIAGAFADQTCG